MHVKKTHRQYKPYSTEKPKFSERNKLLPDAVFELPQSLCESISTTMFRLLKSIYVRLILLVFLQIWIYKRTGVTMISLAFSIFPHVLYLFYDVLPTFGGAKTLTKKTSRKKKKKTCSENKLTQKGIDVPCIDQLREELSCAMCFELFFEPSTTPCGHSFCKKCLQSTANKWRNCPNCKQSISNEGTFPVNTALWNTIQLLFPNEIEVRKAAANYSLNNRPAT